MQIPTIKNLIFLLDSGIMSKENADYCIRICYDAAKIIHLRQTRLRKRRLKMNEIAAALTLVHFLIQCCTISMRSAA